MPNPPPSPATLSTGRLRVGECTVDFALREIFAPGARRSRRVTPKTIAVLGVLIEHAGRVVSREALLAQAWPGTLPTNDVVTQAITQLRKAFDDGRDNPRYIETIAKHGYRLLAPVEAIDDVAPGFEAAPPLRAVAPQVLAAPAAVPSAAPAAVELPAAATATQSTRPATPRPSARRPVSPPLRGDWRAIVIALAVAVSVAGGMFAWTRWREPAPPARAAAATGVPMAPPRATVRMITSVPGMEVSPTLSPDAALVAYSAVPAGQRHSAIMVQTTDPSPPRQLSHPGAGADDLLPAWSPDGRQIAFLRVTSGRECRVLVAPASGGTERSVGICDPRNPPGFDWTHDGLGLIFGSRGVPGGEVGLRILDLGTGAWRGIDYGAVAGDIDFAPRYSPDGRWIVFVRNSPVGDLWRIPATGGPAQRLTRMHADLRGWDWTPDGRGIVLSRWSGSESHLLRLDLDSGLLQDLGVPDGIEPVMAAAGTEGLAFVVARSYFGVHRVALSGDPPASEHLFASSGQDRLAAVAPDSQQLVFTSNRAGDFGLWWAELRSPDSLRLIDGLKPESWHPPDWSPDSRRLLVVGEGAEGRGLYEVTPASGRVLRLPVPGGDIIQALYVPDAPGRLLVLAGNGDGRPRLRLYDRSVTPWRELAAIDGVAVARTDPRNLRVLFVRAGQPGLWQADLGLSPASTLQVNPLLPEVSRYRTWTVSADGTIYFLERTEGCAASLRRQGRDDAPFCVDRTRRAGPHGFSVSPRGDAIYITISLWDGGDIGFMSLPSPREEAGPG